LLIKCFLFWDFDKDGTKYYHYLFSAVGGTLWGVAERSMEIDSLKFAREQGSLRGTLPIAGFARLRDSLMSGGGDDMAVDYEVAGGADQRGRPLLRLKIHGRLALQCQRCLQGLEHALAVDTALRLVPQAALDAEQSDDPDEPDCIAASVNLDLAALIEDEILLSLPAYPRHGARHDEGSCEIAGGGAGVEKISAFSALNAVKSKIH
jgi:uncharacterized protein